MFHLREAYDVQIPRVRSTRSIVGVGADVSTPVEIEKSDLLAYIDKLDPYVEAFDEDVRTKTYNVASEPIAKTISIARDDGASDDRIAAEVELVKTWRGWGFMDGDVPEHPGYYRAWQDMKDQVKSGILTKLKLWPWLVFGPTAAIFLTPVVVAAAGVDAAETRRDQWNNIRDAHKRLGILRLQLKGLGYEPSGGPLPDVPGEAGLLGITPLGDESGKGAAQAWWEKVPWTGVVVVVGLVVGGYFIASLGGFVRAVKT